MLNIPVVVLWVDRDIFLSKKKKKKNHEENKLL